MSEEIRLPPLVVKTPKSEFRLRCHAAAWADQYGGRVKMYRRRCVDAPGLLMLSATGPDTAVKAARATLYQPDVEAQFCLDGSDTPSAMIKARASFDGKLLFYKAAVAKLAPGVVHLVALAKLPGLMPDMSDDHLWAELTGPRFTTPLLRSWIPWLKATMAEEGDIVVPKGFASAMGILKVESDDLDELVSLGVKEGRLQLVD
jgi:hypothetical protein